MRTLASLVFIAGVAGAAVFLAQRPTIASGKVIAADLMGNGATSMTCDDEIAIGTHGAVFRCDVVASDGATGRYEYTMDREGRLSSKPVESTGAAPPQVPASGDPWGN